MGDHTSAKNAILRTFIAYNFLLLIPHFISTELLHMDKVFLTLEEIESTNIN